MADGRFSGFGAGRKVERGVRGGHPPRGNAEDAWPGGCGHGPTACGKTRDSYQGMPSGIPQVAENGFGFSRCGSTFLPQTAFFRNLPTRVARRPRPRLPGQLSRRKRSGEQRDLRIRHGPTQGWLSLVKEAADQNGRLRLQDARGGVG